VGAYQRCPREVIGRVHRETEPALRLLSEEGFIATDMVDIFDAGPVVQCYTKDIDAVRRCQMRTVDTIAPVEGGALVIAASKHEGFRGLCGSMILRDDESSVQLEPAHAQTLGVSVGDMIWCMTPRPHKAGSHDDVHLQRAWLAGQPDRCRRPDDQLQL